MKFCNKCGHQNIEEAQFCQGCGDQVVSITETGFLEKGVVLDERYEIKRLIKAGGMGAVYESIDKRFRDKPCAVKEMASQSSNPTEQQYMIKAFQKEAEILHELRHHCLPIVRDYFVEHGRYYLVMDYIEGKDLDTIMEGYFPVGLPEDKVIEWSLEVLDALDYLHTQSPPIVYRDLKPGNIMIRASDNKAMLIDFGIARRVFPGSQTTKTSVGTPVFAAEELFYGKPEPRSDIYSLGATMYCLLAGEVPLVPFSFKPLREINPSVSEELEEIVMGALSIKATDRFENAKEMKKAIENLKKDTKKLPEPHQHSMKEVQITEPQKPASPVKEVHITPVPSQIIDRLPSSANTNTTVGLIILIGLVILCLSGVFLFKNYFDPDHFYKLAVAEQGKGNNYNAIEYCKKALKIKPDNTEVHKLLLKIYMTDKKYKDSRDELSRVIILDGMKAEYLKEYIALGKTSFFDDKECSKECFEKVFIAPKDIKIKTLWEIADFYKENKENDRGIDYYKSIAENSPDDPNAYIKLGEIYFDKQDYTSSEEYLKRAGNKGSIDASVKLAQISINKEDYTRASEYLSKVKKMTKNTKELEEISDFYVKIAEKYLGKEKINEALIQFNNALDSYKENKEAKEGIKKCFKEIENLIKNKKYKDAREICEKICKTFPQGDFTDNAKGYMATIDKETALSQPVYQQPVYQQPVYQQPVHNGSSGGMLMPNL